MPLSMVVTVARNPLSERTLTENVIQWGTGTLNVDGCLVGSGHDKGLWPVTNRHLNTVYHDVFAIPVETNRDKGRWPSNVILTSESSLEKYFRRIPYEDDMDLPAELIDYLQTLISPPDSPVSGFLDLASVDWDEVSRWGDNSLSGLIARGTPTKEQSDELMRVLKPGAYLLLVAPDEQPTGHTGACRLENSGFEIRDAILLARNLDHLHYVGKATRREKEVGCWALEGRERTTTYDSTESADRNRNHTKVFNTHPTVKPVDLMEKLLATLPGDVVVCDPFLGSGSTGIACVKTGRDFIGIEKEVEYFKIADARIRHWNSKSVPPSRIDSDMDGGDVSIDEMPDSPLSDLFWEK